MQKHVGSVARATAHKGYVVGGSYGTVPGRVQTGSNYS